VVVVGGGGGGGGGLFGGGGLRRPRCHRELFKSLGEAAEAAILIARGSPGLTLKKKRRGGGE